MSLSLSLSKPSAVALALVLSASACTDNTSTNPQATPDLATQSSGADMAPTPLLAVTGTDFTSGALSTVDTGSRAVRKNLDVLDAQPIARAFGSKLYVLDQTHGAVRAYDATQDFKNPLDFPTSKTGTVDGAQANPHDIYVDTPRNVAYVSLYGSFGSTQVTNKYALGVIDLANPKAGLTRFIELTQATADTDGNPEADRLVACNDKLYVLLQDLDRSRNYVASGPGRLAVLSLTNAAAAPTYIALSGQNPTALTVLPGCTEAIVGSAADQYGGTQTGLGGIERVDLVGMTTLGFAMKDMELGGNVSTLDAVDATHVFADLQVKSGTSYNNTVYVVDVVAKKKGAALLGPMGFVPAVRVFDGRLVVLSAGTPGPGQLATGLYLGAATGAPLTDPVLDVGLPPQSVALVYR